MPANTVYVGRPGPWGNPFKVDERIPFRVTKAGLLIKCRALRIVQDAHHAVALYRLWLGSRHGRPTCRRATMELRDKDLACFCRLDNPCHADVLLELANQ